MGRKAKDITGKKFGRLTAIENTFEKKRNSYLWLCKCDCGNESVVTVHKLSDGSVKSCGCLRRESMERANEKAQEKAQEYDMKEKTRLSMLDREMSKNNTSGTTGIYWQKNANKWMAKIMFQRRGIYLGLFTNKQDAIDARKEAEERYFKPILEKYSKSEGTK